MRITTVCTLLLLMALSALAQTAARDLADDCRYASTSVDLPMHDAVPMKVGICLGYVNGSASQLDLSNRVCIPSDSQLSDWVAVVTAYIAVHPERLQDDAAEVVLSALVSAYPCRKRPKVPHPAASSFHEIAGTATRSPRK